MTETPLSSGPATCIGPSRLLATLEDVRARHEDNRRAWNEGATRYTSELEETIAFIRAGGSNLHPIERANLGDLGVDISDVHIANARLLTEAVGVATTWYRCDILDTPHELDGTADLVYTGRGALAGLHDLDGWAAVIYRLLKPGGILHILDGHPAAWLFDPDAETLVASGLKYSSMPNGTAAGRPATSATWTSRSSSMRSNTNGCGRSQRSSACYAAPASPSSASVNTPRTTGTASRISDRSIVDEYR